MKEYWAALVAAALVCTGCASNRLNPNSDPNTRWTIAGDTVGQILKYIHERPDLTDEELDELWGGWASISDVDSMRLNRLEREERTWNWRKAQAAYLAIPGKEQHEAVKAGHLAIGMTAYEVWLIMGREPQQKILTTTMTGQIEEWVYSDNSDMYVYFENGVVTSFQDFQEVR